MKKSCAREIAAAWVRDYARGHRLWGAVINGSAAEGGDEELGPASDVDINLIAEAPEGDKPGKIAYRGVLLDVSFLSPDWLRPWDRVLRTYEIAGAFRRPPLYDATGELVALTAYVAERFAQPRWVGARCQAVFSKIRRGLDGFREDASLLDTVNPWLFPAGICAHAVLVAGLRNPTVRLRYLRAREALAEWGEGERYEELLSLLGCEGMQKKPIQDYLDRLEPIFDLAAQVRRTAFPFQGDITPQARQVAIGGSRALVEEGNHREAVFWIAVTYERCLRILRADAPEAYADALSVLEDFLMELGVGTPQQAKRRVSAIREALPRLEAWTAAHIEKGDVLSR